MIQQHEQIQFSLAEDVGNIELLRARLQGRGLPPHFHDEYSVSIAVRGGLAFDFRGSKHYAPSGVISSIAPGEVHNAYSAGNSTWEFVSLLIPTSTVRQILLQMECRDQWPEFELRVIPDAVMMQGLLALFRRLLRPNDLLDRQAATLAILGDFFRKHSTLVHSEDTIKVSRHAIQRACDFLRASYSEPISVAAVAAHSGLSPYHFLRTFRAAVGMTPHSYLTQVRVAAAKRRLAGGMSAAQTALECGFFDQSHMALQFKRLSLVTPGRYQSAYKG